MPLSNSVVWFALWVLMDRVALSTGERILVEGASSNAKAQARAPAANLSRVRGRQSSRGGSVGVLSCQIFRIESVSGTVTKCHRLTTDIVRRFGLVVIEDLKIGNMSASVKGTIEEPGKNVKRKSGLNRSINETDLGNHQATTNLQGRMGRQA